MLIRNCGTIMLQTFKESSLVKGFLVISGLLWTWVSMLWQGYIIYSVRHKLKQEYIGLSGNEIKSLKLSGVEVCFCQHFDETAKHKFTILFEDIHFKLLVLNDCWFFPFQIKLLFLFADYLFCGITWDSFHRRHHVGFHSWFKQFWCAKSTGSCNGGALIFSWYISIICLFFLAT